MNHQNKFQSSFQGAVKSVGQKPKVIKAGFRAPGLWRTDNYLVDVFRSKRNSFESLTINHISQQLNLHIDGITRVKSFVTFLGGVKTRNDRPAEILFRERMLLSCTYSLVYFLVAAPEDFHLHCVIN